MAFVPSLAQAADGPSGDTPDPVVALHGQATIVAQATPGFPSPYTGPNSLTPRQVKETFDATVYAGLRPWAGAELWINPEIDQGFGLSDTLGVAGYVSGEAYKVGKSAPYFKLPRLFLRQTFALGGGENAVEADANQFAGDRRDNRVVVTVGKFGVVDIFDSNSLAHDARGDFLNWSLIDGGAFDYAANAWGFTFGGSVEWVQGAWTLRTGLFDLSKHPNEPSLETTFGQYQVVGEVERRINPGGRAGAVRIGGFLSRGRLARLADAIAAYEASGAMPGLDGLRRMTDHFGGYLDIEQDVTGTLGLFLRASASDGRIEADDFTDIDRSFALGGQIKGSLWGRGDDRIGLAGVANGISHERQIFLADGGSGILVGDGALPHPGTEMIAESWYQVHVMRGVALTFDYQLVVNPAYNRDRGPVSVFGMRLHGAF